MAAEAAESSSRKWPRKEHFWQRVKIDAAIAAMQGMLARSYQYDAEDRAEVAIKYADALVTEFMKEAAE